MKTKGGGLGLAGGAVLLLALGLALAILSGQGAGDDRRNRDSARWWWARRDRLLPDLLMIVVLVTIVGGLGLWTRKARRIPGTDCTPRPTASLLFDPADEQQLAAFATDIFIGQLLGGAAGPGPASPAPGVPPWITPVQLEVAVLETEKGTATGTVIVHQAFQFGIEGCHGAVAGDYPVDRVGDVLRFFTVRDEPTGTDSLIAGRYSHEFAVVLPGTVLPLRSPTATSLP